MLVHRKNMIRVTVGWTNQFIMNNLKIQMSEGDVFSMQRARQAWRRPQQGGVLSSVLRCLHLPSTWAELTRRWFKSCELSTSGAVFPHIQALVTFAKAVEIFICERWWEESCWGFLVTVPPCCLPFLIPASARVLWSSFLVLSSLSVVLF